jgi:hypothetical protein
MTLSRRLIALVALPLGLCGVANAQQTLTFTNTNPAVTVPLTPSSTVGISANGNVTASCVLPSGVTDRCQGMPTGGGGGPVPIVTITPSFSATPDANNKYPAGTVVTFAPSITTPPGVEACVQVLLSGPTDSGWSGALLPPIGSRQATLATPDATYSFKLRCYNSGGGADSNVVTVSTQAGPPPPPGDDCTIEQQAAADASHPGHTRVDPPGVFPDLRTFSNLACGNFPITGSNVCLMLAPRNRFISLRFTAPADLNAYPQGSPFIAWQSAQVGAGADESATYFSISKCMGDFRIPTTGVAPAGDPTFGHGCRNIRFLNGLGQPPSDGLGISYTITGVTSASQCGIVPGQVYYFNMILADPRGGIQAGEYTCGNQSAPSCGMQIRAQ